MARIRTIKPEFFRHEGLFELERETGLPVRLAFAGLWSASDREGRFKWSPKTLKLDCLPFDECDFSRVLDALWTRGFIVKYESSGREFGHIPSWHEHQVINNRESESTLPAPDAGVLCDRPGRGYKPDGDGFLSQRKGYVYLAHAEASGAFKIGFAERDPERRVADLSCGSPEPLQFVEAIEAEKLMETEIHRALSEHRIHGEWFRVSEESLKAIDAWFTRASRVLHATQGEGKGRERKGREEEGKEINVALRARREQVAAVFDHWRLTMNHQRSVLDDKRRKLIEARMKDGYSIDDLKAAITGCSLSPFHMGQNEQGARYDGLELILRDGSKVDKFLAIYRTPPRPLGKQGQIEARNQAAVDEFLAGDAAFGQGSIIDMEADYA